MKTASRNCRLTRNRLDSDANPAIASKSKGANGASLHQPASVSALEAARDVLVAAGFSVSGDRKMSFAEARTANEVTKSMLNQLRFRERQGELIDRAKVIEVVFSLARMERDALQALPARVSAILAAELKCDPHDLERALEREIRAHLKALGEINVEGAMESARRRPPGIVSSRLSMSRRSHCGIGRQRAQSHPRGGREFLDLADPRGGTNRDWRGGAALPRQR